MVTGFPKPLFSVCLLLGAVARGADKQAESMPMKLRCHYYTLPEMVRKWVQVV